MSKYATLEGATVYEGLDKDPIEAITSALLHNLDTRNLERNLELARIYYTRLLTTIRERGLQGKHIRYAARELNEFSKYSRQSGSYDASRIAASYANQLPKPDDTHKRLGPKVLRTIIGIGHQGRVDGRLLEALL